MTASIHWSHFTSAHKTRKISDKVQVLVEVSGIRWRWLTIQKDRNGIRFIRCDGGKITVSVTEE